MDGDRGPGPERGRRRAATSTKIDEAAILWGVPAERDPRWQAMLASLVAIVVSMLLPAGLSAGPRALVPSLGGALLVALLLGNPLHLTRESRNLRWLQIALTSLIAMTNTYSLVELARTLVTSGAATGRSLLYAAVLIWLTNVVTFSLWYWELDRGGPMERVAAEHRAPDFLFPQMASPGVGEARWTPSYVDYLYVSFTNATAFSPTDTMPLSVTAKALMLVQSLVSFVTVALVAARAVNILH